MKPHVVQISTVHSPADVRIFHKICRTLVDAGYRVTFIVPADADSESDGVAIRALPKRGGLRRRVANLFRMLQTAVRERGDVYHFHDPELLLVGVALKLLGKRVIYDVHEDVPKQMLTKHWIPRWLRPATSKIVSAIEYVGARMCDQIVAATPAIARRFSRHKTAVVQNFPLQRETAPLDATPFGERPASVVYIGGISQERGVQHVLTAMEQLTKTMPGVLVMAGVCQPSSLANEMQSGNRAAFVRFDGWCSRTDVQRIMAAARAGIVTFLPLPNHVEAQPNKLFEYMSAGLPVIASNFPLWREIVEKHRCGILVDPEEPSQIANAIEFMFTRAEEAEAMGRRGRHAVETHYNWSHEAEVLLRVYANCLKSASGTDCVQQLNQSMSRSGQLPSAA